MGTILMGTFQGLQCLPEMFYCQDVPLGTQVRLEIGSLDIFCVSTGLNIRSTDVNSRP